jgi:DNA (cytosine-5)-methyltransferase 1
MDERKPVTINAVSLFTGTGALDAAARFALARFGYRMRTVAYVEKEKFPQQIIRARIEDGLLDAAPIFDDVCTFPGVRFRGLVDAVVAGFPCQPFSVAGKRAGKGDERYLFGEVLRVADEAGVELLLLENVPGLLLEGSGERDDDGVPVGDAAGEPVLAPIGDVARLLAQGGFRFGWLPLSAADMGAPHGRTRWWCVAWRQLADSAGVGPLDVGQPEDGRRSGATA